MKMMPSDVQPSPVTVRRATRLDADALGRLGALLVQLHHDFDPARFIAATRETAGRYGAFLTSQIDQSDVVVLVAERAGAVIGYAYAGVEGPEYMTLRGSAGVLYDIVVDPAERGHGVGRSLLDAAIAALEALHAPRIVLSTAEHNVGAQRLFARAGFRRTMVEMTRESGGATG